MYRERGGALEVLLIHPGGPFWARKDEGAWFLPKGEIAAGEDELAAAQREFLEETGFTAAGPFTALGSVTQKSGKTVAAWAFAGDCDTAAIRSNTFTVEWPPHSGKMKEFPEVDRGAWFSLADAKQKIHPVEWELVNRLAKSLGKGADSGTHQQR